MSPKAKSFVSTASDFLETAAGYALVAVGLYAALFVDMTGGGSLWKTLGSMRETAHEGLESPNAMRVIAVPTQPVVEKVHEDRILAVFDDPAPTGKVSAVYQAPDAILQRPSAALTDTPADPEAGKTWKRSLSGELRSFTVYGRGEEASVSAKIPRAPATAAAPAVRPSNGSAAQALAESASRPGIGSRLSRGVLSASETSRNVR